MEKTWLSVALGGLLAIAAIPAQSSASKSDAAHHRHAGRPAARGKHSRRLPGTGVWLRLPDGVDVSLVGTNFTDASGKTSISISSESSATDPARDAAYRASYPAIPEHYKSHALDGTLYKRTRAENGGVWDGWWLNVVRGPRVLNVRVSYTGNSPARFRELRDFFSTIRWNERDAHPEAAFGLRLTIPGLRIVRSGFGSLLYTVGGQPNTAGTHLRLTSYPVRVQPVAFQGFCEGNLPIVLGRHPHGSIRYAQNGNLHLCDAWSPLGHGEASYYGYLLLPDGSVANVTGRGDPDIFKQTLLHAKLTRKSLLHPHASQ